MLKHVLTSALFVVICMSLFHADASAAFTNFITRSGDKLMDGGSEFRFISINSPMLPLNLEGPWRRTDPWEMEDALKSIAQMGGTVTRVYVFSMQGNGYGGTKVHYYGDGNYDEDLFVDFDKMLQIAEENGIRIFIPFIDQWNHIGGFTDFSRLNGGGNFFTDTLVIQRFKNFISYILNRRNTFTGEKYKDCKAILAWETGNELDGPESWSRDISAFIKSIDSNHLVADGRYCYGIASEESVDDPNMDIYDSHTYSPNNADRIALIRGGRNVTIGKKVFIMGEFGYKPNEYAGMDGFLNTVISSGISGAMIWSLRSHSKDGGFYTYSEASLYVYQWPGIDEDAVNVLNILRNHAFEIRGLPVPERPIPEAPVMLSCSTVAGVNIIKWKGSVGAENYDIQRGTSVSGPWTTVGVGVLENQYPYQPFRDITASENDYYFYRAIANNISGSSPPSEPIGHRLYLDTMLLDFYANGGGMIPADPIVKLINTGAPVPALSATADSAWLHVSVTGIGNSQIVHHTVDQASLETGKVYTSQVQLSAGVHYMSLKYTVKVRVYQRFPYAVKLESLMIPKNTSGRLMANVLDDRLVRYVEPIKIDWQVSGGGNVDSTGYFTSNGEVGNYQAIVVLHDFPGLADTAQVNVCSIDNLALQATATASSSVEGENYGINKVNDGIATTDFNSWCSPSGQLPAWVQLNFGTTAAFNRVELYTTTGYELKDYTIQYWDGTSWVDAASVTGNTQSHCSTDFSSVTCSKIRVYMPTGSAAQPYYARICELEIYNGSGGTGLEDEIGQVEQIGLSVYPSPFNPTTQIRYSIPRTSAKVELCIYDAVGRFVRSLAVSSGSGSVIWNGDDNGGRKVASGVYIVRLKVGNKAVQRRGLFVK